MPRVLIVEDDEDTREAAREFLEWAGFSTAVAADTEQAMAEISKDEKPALILLNSVLPDANASALLKWLRSRPELDGVVIVLVADDPRPQLQPAGAVAVLHKPYDLETLLDVARKYCRAA